MKLKTKEMTLFALLGAVMYGSKVLMEFLPNIHLLAMFIITFTIVFRKKALVPIYIYVLLDGLFGGFSFWWLPYIYIWTLLWGIVMLLPKNMPKKAAVPIYMVTAALHGILFGTLYAPVQALMFGLDFNGMVAWIIAGLPFDAIHAVSNFFAAALVMPLAALLKHSAQIRTRF